MATATATKAPVSMFDGEFEAMDISEYSVESEQRGPRHPWIQASDYEPKLKDKIEVGFVEQAWDMLSDTVKEALRPKVIDAQLSSSASETMYVPQADVRYIVAGMPGLFTVDGAGKYDYLRKGVKLKQNGLKTVARVLMFMLIDGELALNEAGQPEIVMLKLRGLKTGWLGKPGEKTDGTFHSLNTALQQHFQLPRKTLLHLVSVAIGAAPKNFSSADGSQSKVGADFIFIGGAKPLPKAILDQVMPMIEALADEVKDPFGIANQAKAEPTVEDPEIEITIEGDTDEMPF